MSNQDEDTGSINKDEPRWPQPEPKQYALLHHAVTLADQLEAAGVREADWRKSVDNIRLWWGKEPRRLVITICADGSAGANGPRVALDISIGDPLPPELIAAIKATEGA